MVSILSTVLFQKSPSKPGRLRSAAAELVGVDGERVRLCVRIGELLAPLGWDGGKTILDDYLREVRPLFRAARTTQRTIYRAGEICQFDRRRCSYA